MPPNQRFQYKLWDAANICNTGAIYWNKTGDGVIFNLEQFKKEYLGRSNSFCKSSKVTSFVRQLNLYGFKKTPYPWKKGQKKQHEFTNPWFVRDRRDLLDYINRSTICSDIELKAKRKVRKYKEGTATNNKRQRGRPRKTKALQDTDILGEEKQFSNTMIDQNQEETVGTDFDAGSTMYKCKSEAFLKNYQTISLQENKEEQIMRQKHMKTVAVENYHSKLKKPSNVQKLKFGSTSTQEQREMKPITVKILQKRKGFDVKQGDQNLKFKTLNSQSFKATLIKNPIIVQNLQQNKSPLKKQKEKCVSLKIKQLASSNYADPFETLDWSQVKVINSKPKRETQNVVILPPKTFTLSQEYNSAREPIENSEKENHFAKEPDTYKSLQEMYKTDCEISDEYLALKAAYLRQTRSLSSVRACRCLNCKRNIFSFL